MVRWRDGKQRDKDYINKEIKRRRENINKEEKRKREGWSKSGAVTAEITFTQPTNSFGSED